MFRHRYSLRTLLLAVALVAAYFPLARFYHAWFTTKHGGYYIHVLASRLHNGDSLSEVSKHFDSTRLLTADEHDMKHYVPDVWGSNKWIVEDGDQFFHFTAPGGHSANLQFRDGKLVNHQHNAFGDARKLAELNNYSLPHPMLLFGVWPFYLVFVACALIVYSLLFCRRPPIKAGTG